MVTASKLRSANGSASALASAKSTASLKRTRRRALASDLEHVGIDVADRRARVRAAALDHPKRDVAGAAGDVEERKGPRLWRIDRGDQRILPGPMQPERHQVVHQVVAARDAVEDVVDQPLLVLKRHLPGAEMSGFCHR